MEREGSGFDTLYERLLVTGRGAPVASEGIDSVHVVVPRRVVHPGVVKLITEADQRHLVELGLVEQSGRTRATRYFVPPGLLRTSGLDERTTLRRVQPHRLRALILEDLERYPGSSSTEVHQRIGPEIPSRTFRRAL